jgi:hypothetical protein
MTGPDGLRAEARLRRAYDLLRSLFEGPDGEPGAGRAGHEADEIGGPWQSAPDLFEADPWLISATDLLVPWSPEPFAGSAAGGLGGGLADRAGSGAWDAYFAPAETAARLPPPDEPAGYRERPERRPLDARPERGLDAPPERPLDARQERPLDARLEPRPRISLEEPLDDSAAFAAAECLYELVHAIGRLDVDAAMAVVADDYCAVDADREVDAEALRHRLEALVDELRGGEVAVSLTQVPEPIPYRDGLVLIATTLQIDRRPPGPGALPESRLFEWVAVLEETVAGFRICALGPKSDRPSDPLPDLQPNRLSHRLPDRLSDSVAASPPVEEA